jgi:hypothetical protein
MSKDKPVVQALLETGEAGFRALAKGDALAEVPVIGVAFKVVKAVDTVRDQLMEAKLIRFVEGLGELDEQKVAAMRSRLSKEEEARQIGGMLLLTIDKVTAIDKAKLLGRIFLAFVNGIVSQVQLRRLIQAVDVAFFEDLMAYLEAHDLDLTTGAEYRERLFSSGLMRGQVQTFELHSRQFFEVTKDGALLRTLFKELQNAERDMTPEPLYEWPGR